MAAVTGGWEHEFVGAAALSYPDLPELDRGELDAIGRLLVEQVRGEFPGGWVYGTPLVTTLRRYTAPRWIVSWQADFQYWRVYVVHIDGPVD
ncbi:hypothetical protein [Streptomyces atriruber]|uniref:hypothetical protein n=1 Tax=Streptomyces atriruber TaxID=545121 RepID=UPI0006E306AA|nr:hypothetical protein [Streptomyces atriruber]